MEGACVVNESSEIGQTKGRCTNYVVDVPFNEARQRTIIEFMD